MCGTCACKLGDGDTFEFTALARDDGEAAGHLRDLAGRVEATNQILALAPERVAQDSSHNR